MIAALLLPLLVSTGHHDHGVVAALPPARKNSPVRQLRGGAWARSRHHHSHVHPHAAHGGLDVLFEERDLDSDACLSLTGTDGATGAFVTKASTSYSGDNGGGVGGGGGGGGRALAPALALVRLWEEGPGNVLASLFMPTGFSNSARAEYLRYQRWNLLQDACSYLRGIMGTQALLTGMGVGRADTSTLQATVQWVFRDGASMLGGLLFTSAFSNNFGQNVKSWRFFADVINNVGITLDIVAPMLGEYFLPVVCLASIFKALCGVAAGATNAVIAEHWGSKNGNMADVMAKNGAQHTAVNLLGLAVSVKFANFVSASPQRMWTTYAALTAVHMLSNLRAMRVLALRSVNVARYRLLVQRFLRSPAMQDIVAVVARTQAGTTREGDQQVFEAAMGRLDHGDQQQVNLTPASVARAEPILSLIAPRPWRALATAWLRARMTYVSVKHRAAADTKKKDELAHELAVMRQSQPVDPRSSCRLGESICLWASPAMISSRFSKKEISDAMIRFDRLNYFIISTATDGSGSGSGKRTAPVYVCFRKGATMKDQAKAAFEATLYDVTRSAPAARQITLNAFPVFWEAIERNEWDTSRLQLRPRQARVYNFQ